ncbi:unnamed protein product [Pelagomonas calceolata]|uniref:Macro domain-containing protein n=1 Tax=Pelagomonas calceolata TaxID=35677 RepID=A0A8J2WXE5_9STRA|nr:unnamed protein product [Pelagomonas calceolata]
MPDRCASPGVKASAAPIQRAHVLGLAPLPAEPTRLYRDAHRVVLKAKAPFAGYVREVRLRLHGRPAGPADGSGWDVCSYSTRAGAMGESQGYLVEERRRAIRVAHVLGAEQTVRVAPPLYLEAGQYVGVQNSSGDLCAGWRAGWGPGGRGGLCLSLDDEGEHGQYVWKFEGGVASERGWPRGLLETAGRLKERHVGFCAMLSGGAAAAAEAVVQAPVQARLVEGAQTMPDEAFSARLAVHRLRTESEEFAVNTVRSSSPDGGLVDNLAPLARHALKYGELVVSAGSVVDADVDAIVNAANKSCLERGGADGAIARAGGALLAEKRQALPIISGGDKRCEVGDAVVTTGGPFGFLACSVVIHAVGPDYRKLDANTRGGDDLLRDAYLAAMRRAQENHCKTVAFTLLSAGIGRGTRSLENVLEVAVRAIGDMAYPGLQRVHLVAFSPTEQEVLQRVAKLLLAGGPVPRRLPPQRQASSAVLANRVVMLQSEPLNNSTVYARDREIPLGKIGGLDLEGEANKLRQALREAAACANVDVELQVRTATVDAFQSAVTLGARVVHFAGHGKEGIMMFEDGHGGAHALEAKALRRCVSACAAGTCKLVVLNSCKSEDVGRAFVAAGVEHVVAVAQDQNNGRISDRAGIEFCRAFYRSLAIMDSVRTAFDIGCAAAQNTRKNMTSDGRFVLLPEDQPHDEPIFSEIPGSFRETTPPPVPSNAPPPPTFFVGRDSELLVCLESILNHRLTTIGGRYGSGKSALAAKAAAYVRHHRKFDAVVWVEATTHDRFFDDVTGAAAFINTSTLADLASAGRVLVVLNDFERLVTAGDEQRARERCRLLLQGLLEACSNIRVLLTCSSGSGIGLVRGVTEQPVSLGPMAPGDTALLLLQRCTELKRRVTNPYTPLPPKTAPHDVVVACALHPFIKRLNGLPYAVLLAVAILNKLFAAERAEKEACEAAGASTPPPPPSREPLDRALRVLDEPDVFDADLRRFRDELNYVVLYGRGYRPEPEDTSTPAPEFRARIPGGLVLAGLAALVAGYALGPTAWTTTRIAPPPQIEFADDALRRFVEQNGLSAYAAAILGVADSLDDLVEATDEDVDELAAETGMPKLKQRKFKRALAGLRGAT